MTDYQTLNVRVGNATLAVRLRVLGGRIVLPRPDYQYGPFELWMDEPLDVVDADYKVKPIPMADELVEHVDRVQEREDGWPVFTFPITLWPCDGIEVNPSFWQDYDARVKDLIKRIAERNKEALNLLAPFDGPVEES